MLQRSGAQGRSFLKVRLGSSRPTAQEIRAVSARKLATRNCTLLRSLLITNALSSLEVSCHHLQPWEDRDAVGFPGDDADEEQEESLLMDRFAGASSSSSSSCSMGGFSSAAAAVAAAAAAGGASSFSSRSLLAGANASARMSKATPRYSPGAMLHAGSGERLEGTGSATTTTTAFTTTTTAFTTTTSSKKTSHALKAASAAALTLSTAAATATTMTMLPPLPGERHDSLGLPSFQDYLDFPFDSASQSNTTVDQGETFAMDVCDQGEQPSASTLCSPLESSSSPSSLSALCSLSPTASSSISPSTPSFSTLPTLPCLSSSINLPSDDVATFPTPTFATTNVDDVFSACSVSTTATSSGPSFSASLSSDSAPCLKADLPLSAAITLSPFSFSHAGSLVAQLPLSATHASVFPSPSPSSATMSATTTATTTTAATTTATLNPSASFAPSSSSPSSSSPSSSPPSALTPSPAPCLSLPSLALDGQEDVEDDLVDIISVGKTGLRLRDPTLFTLPASSDVFGLEEMFTKSSRPAPAVAVSAALPAPTVTSPSPFLPTTTSARGSSTTGCEGRKQTSPARPKRAACSDADGPEDSTAKRWRPTSSAPFSPFALCGNTDAASHLASI